MNSQPIKLRRQARAFVQVPAGREGELVAFLNGDDAAAGPTGASGSNDALKRCAIRVKRQKNLRHHLRL